MTCAYFGTQTVFKLQF